MADQWEDLDVTLVRSVLSRNTWSPVLSGMDEAHTYDGAGPINAVKRYAIAEARQHGYIEPDDAPARDLRWRPGVQYPGESLVLQQRVRSGRWPGCD